MEILVSTWRAWNREGGTGMRDEVDGPPIARAEEEEAVPVLVDGKVDPVGRPCRVSKSR